MIIRWAFCCVLALACTTSAFSAARSASDTDNKATAKSAPKATSKAVSKPAAKAGAKAAAKPASKTAVKGAPKVAARTPVKSSPKPALKTASKPAAKAAPKLASSTGSRPPSKWVPRAAAALAPEVAAWTHKTALKMPANPGPALRGKTETLTCTDGTEDRHARIGVVLVGGKVDGFAYYSKWKPRTCSIYLQRNRDGYSRWVDKGNVTNVSLERGLFLIEHKPGEYRFVFQDVDRERFCGMDGLINGSLTILKGSERCEITGIMEEGVALGQAYALAEESPAPAVAASAPDAAPRKQLAQTHRREPQSVWPSASVGIGD